MNRGYVKIWRNIEDSGLVSNAETCRMFVLLLVRATHRPHTILAGTQVVMLRPGEFFAGRKQLALELRSTERKVRTSLSTLQKMGIIALRATSKGTVISLLNWHKYQDTHPAERPAHDPHKAATPPAGSRRTATKQAQSTGTELYPPLIFPPLADPFMPADVPASVPALPAAPASPPAAVPAGPSLAFQELRELYDREASHEAPLAGWAEFRELCRIGQWPGAGRVAQALAAFAAGDGKWQRGYRPGLARFLKERWWLKQAVPDRTGTTGQSEKQRQGHEALAAARYLQELRNGNFEDNHGAAYDAQPGLPA